MTEMTYVDPNDFIEFKDASKLQKGDYVCDANGDYLYLVLNKDMTSSNLMCRDMQTGTKNSINPRGIQQYIGTEGWTCRRYGDAASGVKISEEEDKAIAETLRIAGVQLDEAYTGLSSIRSDNRNARRNHIVIPQIYSDGNLGLETNEEWFELTEKLKNYKDWKDREHSYGFIDINGKQIKFEIKEKMMPQKYVWLSRIK